MADKNHGQGLYRNNISYFGLLIMMVGGVSTLAFLVIQWFSSESNPYLGIFTYLILPAIIASGILLFFLGMVLESRSRKKKGAEAAPAFPILDFNESYYRKRLYFVVIAGTVFAILLALLSYEAFHFTESVTFCGKVCHTVMEPEYSAYQKSPHARVKCVECHVGSGASWYIKSKLSGAHQVFAVLFHSYETPISTPVKNLRPARETCEECHWPNKFYGAQLLQIPYYRYDKNNTSDQISLLIKTGGGSAKLGQSAGIHYHMIISNRITFAAKDSKLQDIPWFKVTGAYGQEREYRSMDNPISDKELENLPKHVMDCMDCHNRPTHVFTPPDRAVDLALENGTIDKSLPWIKKIATDALSASYPDNKTALKSIRDSIFNFYSKNYPKLYRTKQVNIENTVAMASNIYSHTVFPKMKVNWATYADNIGHRNWPGCFRCHDGKHVTKDGKVLTHKCTTCHTMPQRGPIETLGATPPISKQGWHPFALQGRHASILCDRCHRAGVRPSPDCSSCHGMSKTAPMADIGCTSCHPGPGVKLPIADCRSCHDNPAGLHKKGGHPEVDCTSCHAQHKWKVTERDTCLTCHDDKKDHYKDDGICVDCHDFTAD